MDNLLEKAIMVYFTLKKFLFLQAFLNATEPFFIKTIFGSLIPKKVKDETFICLIVFPTHLSKGPQRSQAEKSYYRENVLCVSCPDEIWKTNLFRMWSLIIFPLILSDCVIELGGI